MTDCIWLLLGSHGAFVLLLNFILILLPITCIVLCLVIVVNIRLQSSQHATSSNGADDQISLYFFQFFKICSPVVFAITTVVYFLNYIFDLHVENPIDQYWVSKLENTCQINMQTIVAITSVATTAATQFSFFVLALFYFFRIVIIFERSAFAVPLKTRKIIHVCSIICFIMVVMNIPIRLLFSRIVLALALAVMFLLFVGFSVYFQRFLIKQMKNIVSGQSCSNPHVQRTFSTLIRMTVLFAVSIGSSTSSVIIYTAFIAAGLYGRLAEVRSLVTLVTQLDMFINLMCIALQFPFAEKLYVKMCTVCHHRFQDKYKLAQAMNLSSTPATAESSLHQSTINTQSCTIEIDE